MNVDWLLFQTMNGLAGRWPLFDGAVQFLMNDYALTTALTVLVVVLWFRGRTQAEREADQAMVVYTIVAILVSAVALKALNLAFFRPRPFTNHEVNLLFYHPSDSSLPSNSATVAFVLAVGLAQRSRWLGGLAIVMGTVLGLARVIGGVHYPLDIVAGALMGWASVWLVVRCSRLLNPLVRGVRWLAGLLLLA